MSSTGKRKLDRIASFAGLDQKSSKIITVLRDFGTETVGELLLSSPLIYLSLRKNDDQTSVSEQSSIAPTLSSIVSVIRNVSSLVAPKPLTAFEMIRSSSSLSMVEHSSNSLVRWNLKTGIDGLDKTLSGGLPSKMLSEIAGPPGIGKTQFCLTCLLSAMTVTDRSSVIYIDTELKLDAMRLAQMAANSFPSSQVDHILSRVKILRPSSSKELKQQIDDLENMAVIERASLIVIDSIAALARKEAMNERDREEFFIQQSVKLKRIAELCNCVVLATNQAVAATAIHLEDGSGVVGDANAIFDQVGNRLLPALGPAWHHCVSVRLTMSIQPISTSGSDQPRSIIFISKSPSCASRSIPFIIGSKGVQGVL